MRRTRPHIFPILTTLTVAAVPQSMQSKNMTQNRLSRGLRNNNPGNIVKSGTKWLGEVKGTDARFCTFSNMAYGYRALIRLLQTYQWRHGLRTPKELIGRWAPACENNTGRYVERVCRSTGFGPNQVLDLGVKDTAVRMAAAISLVENGRKADMADVEAGWRLLVEG